ncbi:Uracil-DNA glycosylase [Pseudovibrio axinellae]|uniref:Uracil-DNA glycosylase n=1 Tax=Pseudovibrio axinellae TaxID=989403 RepID=A0A161UZM8_9HYPH|nr:uracil-DNA glycosylase [Pseudovibrio axinellae]KZL06700.1 Uracil-DNA glycosylase [Pseudovibrio axinellae]SER61049.1 Uracil-DNA glycosylase [Pseudovibrio axinellae]
MVQVQFEEGWQSVLAPQMSEPYFQKLQAFLEAEAADGKVVYPPETDIYAAFNAAPLKDVRVVILGQDPYHGEGQAHGLSFSVRKGVKLPPSLRNIYKELESDLGIEPALHGCLTHWAEQGVLLLNTSLSVEAAKAGSHSKKGWAQFTDAAIKGLSERRENLVFILWGAHAQNKIALIDEQKHLVLRSVHPSPLSARRGFFGSAPFSKTNSYLKECGLPEIDWKVL